MVTEFRVFPDIEAIVGKALRDANISGIGTRWYSSVPNTPVYPIGVVQRLGGNPPVRPYLDAGVIQIEVWGTSKAEARDIAARARIAILELEGTAVMFPEAAFVTGVDDSRGLTWQPDELTGRDRYLFNMEVFARSM